MNRIRFRNYIPKDDTLKEKVDTVVVMDKLEKETQKAMIHMLSTCN